MSYISITNLFLCMNYMKRLCESISVVLLPRFHILLLHDSIKVSITEMEMITIKAITETELTKGLREQYIKNPPEGMTSDEVRDMDDEDLLDMDYFLHEFDDLDDDDFGAEGFYIF